MSSIVPLGLIGLVVAFLGTLFNGFPLPGVDGSSIDTSEIAASGDMEAVEEVGDRFAFAYCSIIGDVASFQTDPSLERANARRDEFVGYSKALIDRYKDFTVQLQSELDNLALEADEGGSQLSPAGALGDVNDDGAVNVLDMTRISRIILGLD